MTVHPEYQYTGAGRDIQAPSLGSVAANRNEPFTVQCRLDSFFPWQITDKMYSGVAAYRVVKQGNISPWFGLVHFSKDGYIV